MEDYNKNMGKLINLNETESQALLDEIFDNEIVVFEDVQGSKIWVNWNGSEFSIKPKSISNQEINLVDLAMQNYYNPAILYLNSLDARVKSLLNKKWWFCFEYFPDSQPANIEYERTPKNNLVLSTIYKNGKYDFAIDEISEYARLFDVDMLPIIFQGVLSERMIEAIKYFLNTSEEDLEYVFGAKPSIQENKRLKQHRLCRDIHSYIGELPKLLPVYRLERNKNQRRKERRCIHILDVQAFQLLHRRA
jgi:hypothetical protein